MNRDGDDEIVVVMGGAMAAAPTLMTIDDYFATPESLAPTELAFGVLRVADSPSARHQSVVLDLLIALEHYVREKKLGRMWVSPLAVEQRVTVIGFDGEKVRSRRIAGADQPIPSDVLPGFGMSLRGILGH